jgi:hypothetical protein
LRENIQQFELAIFYLIRPETFQQQSPPLES